MSKIAYAFAAAALIVATPVLAQSPTTPSNAAAGNPTLDKNKNTPNAMTNGVPATISNDTPTGSNVPGGGTATGGPVGGSKSSGGN